jgi:threonine synthase
MKFYSTNNKQNSVSFEEAIFNSLPLDNGLYYPEAIPELDKSWMQDLKSKDKTEIGLEVASRFIEEEIPKKDLERIVRETVDFDLPLVKVADRIHAMELFHGPTWAFKDVGARFLSRCMGYFTQQTGQEVTILVATSGDTGSAVAAGFFKIQGVQVKILYPKGMVSDIQKKQLTTWGENIEAFEVAGTFDDCQHLVKTAFMDKDLIARFNLSSANSINIARLIPQSFYYFYAVQQIETHDKPVICVPSGNYGNLTAGLWAWKMGLPVKRFIAAANANHVVPDYLATGEYKPKPSVQTFANAMDVGDPSNFVRMLELFDRDHSQMSEQVSGFQMSDEQILKAIKTCNSVNNYLLDPHGAIGYQALIEKLGEDEIGIFLETAHPVKFLDVMEKSLEVPLSFVEKTKTLAIKMSTYQSIENSFDEFKGKLLQTGN